MRNSIGRSANAALSVLAVLGVLCIVVTLAGVFFNVRALVFTSGSMSPTIDTGALGLSRPVEAADLAVGDIVSVPVDDSRVTHRITGIDVHGDRATLTLKGDANSVEDADPYVVASADRVFFHVPMAGYVVSALSGPVGLFLGGMLAAGLLYLIFRPSRREPESRSGPTHAAVLAVMVMAVPALLAAGRVVPTMAAWTDEAKAASGSFAAHTVASQARPTCTNEGGVLSGLLGYARLSWPHVDTQYDYTWTAINASSGVQLNSGVIAPSGGVGSSVTLDVKIGLLNLGLGNQDVDVRVQARFKGAPAWQARTVTVTRVRSAQLLVGLSVRCGDTETTGPAIGFTMPYNNRPTSGVLALQSAVRDACGSANFGCGTVSDASGVQSVDYQLKRVGNTTGTKCFNGNIYVDECRFIAETNVSGTQWKLDDAWASTAYLFDGTFTLTIRAVDKVGNVSEKSATFTAT